jgi:hypothetical protein
LLSAGVASPVFSEIRAFIAKASGVPSVVREALRDLEGAIDVAVILGSVANLENLTRGARPALHAAEP